MEDGEWDYGLYQSAFPNAFMTDEELGVAEAVPECDWYGARMDFDDGDQAVLGSSCMLYDPVHEEVALYPGELLEGLWESDRMLIGADAPNAAATTDDAGALARDHGYDRVRVEVDRRTETSHLST